MANRIVLNETSYHGRGAIEEIANEVKVRGFHKDFLCSDPDLLKFHVTDKVIEVLKKHGLDYEIYSNIKANPTIGNVLHGVESFKNSQADYIIAVGGGSSIDTAKAMGVEGVEKMNQEEYRKTAVEAVAKLANDVGIPKDLKEIVKEEDLDFLATSAFNDACKPGNPREAPIEDIKNLYKSLM